MMESFCQDPECFVNVFAC